MFLLLQKFKNAIKSDILEKCPKCEEQDCDCVIREDEPMIMIPSVDSKKEINSAVPMYTVPTSASLRTFNEKTYRSISPSATMTQLDKADENKN